MADKNFFLNVFHNHFKIHFKLKPPFSFPARVQVFITLQGCRRGLKFCFFNNITIKKAGKCLLLNLKQN